MKRLLCAVFSLFIPGLGHMLLSRWKWGVFWLLTSFLTCGVANFFAALHIFVIDEGRAS
jgi:TM2 domain-containing membrane protein YozV